MKQVLCIGIRNETECMKVTPPQAVCIAPLAQEDDMRWNPNETGDEAGGSLSRRRASRR